VLLRPMVAAVDKDSRPQLRDSRPQPPAAPILSRSRLDMVARMKATGRAPPKKGQGKRSGGKK